MVYSAVVLSVMRYGLHVQVLYRRDEKKLSFVHFKHLRSLLGYSWRDGMSYVKLLNAASQLSISQMLQNSRMKYLHSLANQPHENNLPLKILRGELAQGKRHQGGQTLKFRRLLKKDMMAFPKGISTTLGEWKLLPVTDL